ncbi:MAG: CoA-binding protein [Candidatus Bathyarchaeota archaeon]|nr:CoA-binding protein [Candidatus Bathyarchaeota archaeon]
MSQSQIREILLKYRVIAVVGLSDEPGKPSYSVAAYLQKHGYRIIPVNPNIESALGQKSYGSLLEVPPEIQCSIEVVDIFRRSNAVAPIVEQAIMLKRRLGRPMVVWMQMGVADLHSAALAQKAGLAVVMNKCMMEEHFRLLH